MLISKARVTALLAAGVLAGALAGAALSAGAQETAPPPSDAPAEEAKPRAHKRHHNKRHGEPIRSESVHRNPADGTIHTVRKDHGVLQSVEGSTLVLLEADGTTVRVPTGEDTKVVRDGQRASVGDLQAGDHVATVQKGASGDEMTTVGVRAVSAERRAEMEARKEACRADPEACRAERRAEMEARKEACRADPEACRAERRERCEQNPDRCKRARRGGGGAKANDASFGA